MDIALHELALTLERKTGRRVIAARLADLNPERIGPFLRDQVRLITLQNVLEGRETPLRNLFLLSHEAETGDVPTMTLYEFADHAAACVNRIFKGSDEFGYSVN